MDNLKADLESFLHDITCEYYLYGSGQKNALSLGPVYGKYDYLFKKETINNLPPEERKLRGFLINHYVGEKTSGITEALSRKKSEKKFYIDEHEITYSRLQVLLSSIQSRKDREYLFHLKIEFVEKELNPLYRELFQKIYDSIREFSYGKYFEYLLRIQNIDFDSYANIFPKFLEDTREIYTHHMNKQLEKIGISLNSATVYDTTYLFRGGEYDSSFKSDYLTDFLKEFLLNIGINLSQQKNVHIDTEERPNKSPRAFCAPCNIPAEVYLNILPRGGYRDYETILHEMGHTQHFAHTSYTLKTEDRYLGDMGLSEVYAFLFQYLLTDPVFVEYYFDIYGEDLDRFIQNIMLSRLFLVRRYIAKFAFELRMHKTENLEEAPHIYRDTLKKALYIEIPEELYLEDTDMDFYSANYLRAWFAEAVLNDYLKTKFGNKWFISKKAGNLLKELWFEGKKWQIEEMLSEVTGRTFDVTPLTDTFKKYLRII